MSRTLSTELAMRYSRQILLGGFDLDKQEQLINASALLIGVGGLGCAAAQYLVASGIGKLTMVDDDTVETTNLQRQVLHSESSLGINKCASAKVSLSRLNSTVDIHTIEQRQTTDALHDLVKKHDVVLDCTDNLETRNQLNQVCYDNKTPLVSGAAIRMEGQLLCIIPSEKSACYACVSHLFGEQNLSCVESGVMSPIVGIIGATQALEAIKIVTQYGEPAVNRMLMFDGMSMQWQRFNIPKRDGCPVCQ